MENIKEIKKLNPSVGIIHLYGNIDSKLLNEHKMHLYPFTAATIAKLWPVLPDVFSTIVPPGLNKPSFSAC